jgi:hypothetical protein
VDVPGFVRAWAQLGLAVSASHAAGLFNKYGQDVRSRLPIKVRTVPAMLLKCSVNLLFAVYRGALLFVKHGARKAVMIWDARAVILRDAVSASHAAVMLWHVRL